MNVHDSEKMAGLLLEEGYKLTEAPRDADIVIFNTCSIREKAEQKFRSELGRMKNLKKRNPGLKIAVAGCMAQQHGKTLSKNNSHVDYVFGPQNIQKLKEIIKTNGPVISIEDNPEIEYTDLPVSRNDKYRSWVSIMYGCNNFCSYCIVPYTRGREKSRPSKNILTEISSLAENGVKEITLLGQNVNSYKSDLDFPELLKKIDLISGIERIRFVTSHPRDLSDNLILCIKELPKVCEHLHLPLQSGSSRILKLMNRGYSFEEYMAKINKLKTTIPEISITTDIIAGFPSETDEDHAATMNALKNIEYDGIFAFNFSTRHGTKASEMDKHVPDNIKSERLYQILELQDKITLKKNKSLVGTIQEALVEETYNVVSENMIARTRSNKIVNFQGDRSLAGKIINVEITKALKHSLKAILKV